MKLKKIREIEKDPNFGNLFKDRRIIENQYYPLQSKLKDMYNRLVAVNDSIDKKLVDLKAYEPLSLLTKIYEQGVDANLRSIDLGNISLVLEDGQIINLSEDELLYIATKTGWGNEAGTLVYSSLQGGIWKLTLETGHIEHWLYNSCTVQGTAIGFFNCLIYPHGEHNIHAEPIPVGIQTEKATELDSYYTELPDNFFPYHEEEEKGSKTKKISDA